MHKCFFGWPLRFQFQSIDKFQVKVAKLCLLFFVFFCRAVGFVFVGCWLLVVGVVGWLLVVARGC